MVMDCEAWNVGWQPAFFGTHTDDNTYWVATDPYYPYRHPGKTANVVYMDGHVDRRKSFAAGEGARIYRVRHDANPDGSSYTDGSVYDPNPPYP